MINLNSIPWSSIMIAAGSIIVVIGGFWATLEQGSTNKKLESLTQENQQLTKELHQTVTGGNSYPFFVYGPDIRHIGEPNIVGVTIAITGDRPIFDASIEHTDITDRLDPEQYSSHQEFINAFLAKNVGPIKGGTFLPNRAFPVGFVQMKPDWDKRVLRITTVARNGAFTQLTTLKKSKEGLWYMADVKVTKEKPGGGVEVLRENGLSKKESSDPND